ncbi:MAG: hypothetical protein PHI35_03005, partial [Victivallaceae bacterium]|nr:hypothetical protein [Victivallaceae bacterium]
MKYLVIGDPVEHSRSPEMQNAVFASYGLPPVYGKLRVTAYGIPDFIEYARRELDGFNATVPHKAATLPYLDRISDTARAAGSVNFVKIENGLLYGDSTDGY